MAFCSREHVGRHLSYGAGKQNISAHSRMNLPRSRVDYKQGSPGFLYGQIVAGSTLYGKRSFNQPRERLATLRLYIDDAKLNFLMQETQRGNNNAFEELYNYMYPKVYAFLRVKYLGRGCSAEDFEDLTAEALTKAYQCRGDFDVEKGSCRSWLFAIADHKTLNLLRQLRRLVPIHRCDSEEATAAVMEALAASVPDLDISLSMKLQLAMYMREWTPKQRIAIHLVFIYGFTRKEAASVLGVGQHVVDARIQRAFEKVRIATCAPVLSMLEKAGEGH